MHATPGTPDAGAVLAVRPPGVSEAEWRARAVALEESIAAMQGRLAYAGMLEDQWRSLVLGTGQYQAVGADALKNLRAEEAQINQALTAAKGDLSTLQDEARKSGARPGWLRPLPP